MLVIEAFLSNALVLTFLLISNIIQLLTLVLTFLLETNNGAYVGSAQWLLLQDFLMFCYL